MSRTPGVYPDGTPRTPGMYRHSRDLRGSEPGLGQSTGKAGQTMVGLAPECALVGGLFGTCRGGTATIGAWCLTAILRTILRVCIHNFAAIVKPLAGIDAQLSYVFRTKGTAENCVAAHIARTVPRRQPGTQGNEAHAGHGRIWGALARGSRKPSVLPHLAGRTALGYTRDIMFFGELPRTLPRDSCIPARRKRRGQG